MSDLDKIMKSLDAVEGQLKAFDTKAEAEKLANGKVSLDTKTAIDNIGTMQREFADRLLKMEQSGSAESEIAAPSGLGEQFTKSEAYKSFVSYDGKLRASATVKNTVTNAVANTFGYQSPNFVGGAFREFTVEALLTTLPTDRDSIIWTRENVFTNAAAETAEGTQKPESAITTTTENMPVSTVAHWLKISRQLAMDNKIMAAYINLRMVYGLNLRVESQLVVGNGALPNLSGFTKAGNNTLHGYTAASLAAAGHANNGVDLIGKMIGDCSVADYKASGIILNTADWWTLRLAKDSQGQYLLGGPGMNVAPQLFGLPVAASNAMPVGKVLVGDLRMAATMYDREGVSISAYEQDEKNVQLNLITILAERRLALTVERPAAIRYGDLVPA